MPSLSSLSLYWHTLRHLKPIQLSNRMWRKIAPATPDTRLAPKIRGLAHHWSAPITPAPCMTGPKSFIFLNEPGKAREPADWNTPERDKLWLYNLHYFDDLRAQEAEARTKWHRSLIAQWIEQNPPGFGNGWEPYPLSLRIVNWVKWAVAGNELEQEWVQSLAIQVRFLRKSLEWHLLGNHLLANAKALVFAGLFFEGQEADEWRKKGLSILGKQLSEQILLDGGHFELSPMYHCIILEDLLDLQNLNLAYPNIIPDTAHEYWHMSANHMRSWLNVMTHPDGEISFFNDAAFGICAAPAALDRYAIALGLGVVEAPQIGITHLKSSGYIRVQHGELVAILDVAPIGPSYLPGHAHADTLSFELSVNGQRIIVNSGTSLYGVGAERQRQRSTAAHNTLEIDGESSSEVWSGFRVARRARPFNLQISESENEIIIKCSHDGYRRLRGNNICTRTWKFSNRMLCVIDQVSGPHQQAVARFHCHPGLQIEAVAQGVRILQENKILQKCTFDTKNIQIIPSTFHPEFGVSKDNNCVIAISDTGCITTKLSGGDVSNA